MKNRCTKYSLLAMATMVLPAINVYGNNLVAATDTAGYEEVLVTGGRGAIRTLPGSASFIDQQAIETFDSSDINSLLGQVPGVNVRLEDGYGLRPNIGIRGATSDRSQKITLMEDGILIAPSPYSAPAAYYFPNISRMAAVEVFKGPSSIQYGPHTVGGAINLVTPSIPSEETGSLDVTVGSDVYYKTRIFYGDNSINDSDQWGFWVDVLSYGADGFKSLDSGGDSGFSRNDINTKVRWTSDDSVDIQQRVDIKLGYAQENADETYLGLSDQDFNVDSNRRYAASALDKFDSEHWQAHILYQAKFNEAWQLNAKAYVNRFDRQWNKFDGFLGEDSAAPVAILADSIRFNEELALLRGDRNSDGSAGDTLDITNSDRTHGSQGIELKIKHLRDVGEVTGQIEAGIRFHHDYVERDHSVRGYAMDDGQPVFDGITRDRKLFNKADTDALALFVSSELGYQNWKLNLGLRYEDIEAGLTDRLTGGNNEKNQDILLPGLGIFYQWTEHLGFLLGVNKGFSPAGPGAGSDVEPEESLNYEYGLRYQKDNFTADAVGFFSDYDNLLGRCRVSDIGCNPGDEFNGGSVEVAGLEVSSTYTGDLHSNLLMPITLVYTYTETAFQSSFISGFSQWNTEVFNGGVGAVTKGDELPYVPEHQLQLQIGVKGIKWGIDVNVNYVSEMREVPGSRAYTEGEFTEAYTIISLAGSYQMSERWRFKLIGENIADKQVIVSRRPFGARPNQPRLIKLNVNYTF